MTDRKTRRIVLNQTRNIYDRGRFLVGDGITEYEVTEENARMAVEQGWALVTDDAAVNAQAKKGVSPVTVIGGSTSVRKVAVAEPVAVDELDYSKVPTTPATATIVRSSESARAVERHEIVPSDTGERAVGTKDTVDYDARGNRRTVRKGGDARAGAAKGDTVARMPAGGGDPVAGTGTTTAKAPRKSTRKKG